MYKYFKIIFFISAILFLLFHGKSYAVVAMTYEVAGNRGIVDVTLHFDFDVYNDAERNGFEPWGEVRGPFGTGNTTTVLEFPQPTKTATINFKYDSTRPRTEQQGQLCDIFIVVDAPFTLGKYFHITLDVDNTPSISCSSLPSTIRGIEQVNITYSFASSYKAARIAFYLDNDLNRSFLGYYIPLSTTQETSGTISAVIDTTAILSTPMSLQFRDGNHIVRIRNWYETQGVKNDIATFPITVHNRPEGVTLEPDVWFPIQNMEVNATYSFPPSSREKGYLTLYLNDEEVAVSPPISLNIENETTGVISFYVDATRLACDDYDLKVNGSLGMEYFPNFNPQSYDSVYVGRVAIVPVMPTRIDELINKTSKQTPLEVIDTVGDPVNVANGNMHTTRTDVHIPTEGMPLILSTTYNSQDNYAGPFGYGWHGTFEHELLHGPDGDVLVVDGDGVVTIFDLQADGSYTSSAGKYSSLKKNADASYALMSKHGTQYDYNAAGKLTAITDRNGNSQTLLYDANGVLYEVESNSGQALSFISNADGKITSVTDPAGNVHAYAHDVEGNLTSVTDPLGNVTAYEYDADHNLTRKIDKFGTSLYFVYDGEDRAIRNWQGIDTNLVELTYSGGVTTVTDSLGRATVYQYNDYGLVTSAIDALGNVETTVWDENMNKTAVTDKNGNTTAFTYDEMGNLTAVADPSGAVSTFDYEPAFNQVTRSLDPLGHETNYEYDSFGNLVVTSDALLNETLYEYDADGNVIKSTDAKGNVTTFAYDDAGNLISMTDALGNVTQFTYDAAGNVLSITDALGRVTAFTYDGLNRQTSITYADLAQVYFAYDAMGNRTRITDAKGVATNFVYDSYSRLAETINGLAYVTSYTYDTEGNQLSVTDANGNATQYQYDALDRVLREITALAHETAYAYDAAGNRVLVTDAKGQAISYTYDERNLLTTITYPDTTIVAFAYDAAGRRTGMTDQQGLTVYSYDALGRLIAVDGPEDADTITYGYDAVGNRVSMTDQEGDVTSYEYDGLDRLVRLIGPDLGVTTYNYDAVSNLVKMAYPNGTVAVYSYDNRNRVTEVLNKKNDLPVDLSLTNVLCAYNYEYDLNGMRTKAVLKNEAWIGYEYDAVNQLVREEKERINQNDAQVTRYLYEYTYDAVGNRVHMKRMFNKNLFWREFDGALPAEVVSFLEVYKFGASDSEYVGPFEKKSTEYERWPIIDTVYAYNAENALFALNEDLTYQGSFFDIKDTSFTYDANGNTVQSTVNGQQSTDYAYDFENRLISVDHGLSTVDYSYDGTGKRTYSLENGIETHYYYDGLTPIIERDASGMLTAQTVRGIGYGGGIGSVISRTSSFINNKGKLKYKTLYYHYDGLGNVVKLSNANANGAGNYAYDAFGNDLANENTNTENNPYEFSTKETSAVTGLTYFGARYYDPKLGRWITKDPMGMIDGPNLYAYVGNNPINFIDPWGLCAEDTERDKAWWPAWTEVFVPGYGNYGGPFRTDPSFQTKPEDSMDRLFMKHDIGWAQGKGKPADEEIIKELYNLPANTKDWVEPPKSSWKSESYRRYVAEPYFWWRSQLLEKSK
jgi:RHS repeat-associated protein